MVCEREFLASGTWGSAPQQWVQEVNVVVVVVEAGQRAEQGSL